MNPQKITCPNCKTEISLDEAISHDLEEKLRLSLKDEFNKKWVDEKKKLEEKALADSKKEIQDLEEKLNQRNKQLDEAREFELKLRKQKDELEEREKNLEIETKRRLEEEKQKIQETAEKRVKDEYQLTMAEKDKLTQDLLKQIEDLKQKATQGSQQLQGEIMELAIESILRQEFPIDEIEEVGKGRLGADIIQKVRDSNGRVCGVIVWESKRTKNFEDGWIDKLKDDMREKGGDVAVLVTQVLPKDMKLFGHKNGVYIVSFESFLQLTQVLRKSLIDLTLMKSLSVGKNEKIEALYQYITSNEFAQKIGAMMDTYSKMEQTLDREKVAMQRIWSQREKEIMRLKTSTLTIHGSLSGLIDEPLSEIKELDFPEIEEIILE